MRHRHTHATRRDARELSREGRQLLKDVVLTLCAWGLLSWLAAVAHGWVSH